jgi:hypothetical protein
MARDGWGGSARALGGALDFLGRHVSDRDAMGIVLKRVKGRRGFGDLEDRSESAERSRLVADCCSSDRGAHGYRGRAAGAGVGASLAGVGGGRLARPDPVQDTSSAALRGRARRRPSELQVGLAWGPVNWNLDCQGDAGRDSFADASLRHHRGSRPECRRSGRVPPHGRRALRLGSRIVCTSSASTAAPAGCGACSVPPPKITSPASSAA